VQLHAGEHRFIDRESYVYYRGAMIKDVAELQAAEKIGTLKMHDQCSAKLLELVKGGISASDHCKKAINKFYQDHKHL
jgi:hypothetical protein